MEQTHKTHHGPRAGKGREKKMGAKRQKYGLDKRVKKHNAKAFGTRGGNIVPKITRQLNREQSNMHIPTQQKSYVVDPAPMVVAVVGPAGTGKTTLIQSLVKRYTRQRLPGVKGPITVVAGKIRRLTFIECGRDLSVMCDAAKIADMVLLTIDATHGFEMETFEFINLCQTHGMPRIFGVLTHLDKFKDNKALRRTKKILKHRFWQEVVQGSKLFFLSGLQNGSYPAREMLNLTKFIAVTKVPPRKWRSEHPCVLADRIDDLTPADELSAQGAENCPRRLGIYGYVRGKAMKENQRIHIPGLGDFNIDEIEVVDDPCPLPQRGRKQKDRHLTERDRRLYAPMSDVGDVTYDKSSLFVQVPAGVRTGEGADIMRDMQTNQSLVDEQLKRADIDILPKAEGAETEDEDDEDLEDEDEMGSDVEQPDDDEDLDDDEGGDDGVEDDDEDIGGVRLPSGDDEEGQDEDLDFDDEGSDDGDDDEDETGLNNVMAADWQPPASGGGDDAEDLDLFSLDNTDAEHQDYTRRELKIRNNWNDEDTRESIRDLFVTGAWDDGEVSDDEAAPEKGKKNEKGKKDDKKSKEKKGKGKKRARDEDDDADQEMVNIAAQLGIDTPEGGADDVDEDAEYQRKKLEKKREFDARYDARNSGASLEEVKATLDAEAERVKRAVQMAGDIREQVKLVGYFEGLYVRIVLKEVPAAFMTRFHPEQPVVLGGLEAQEEQMGLIYVRVKKHRWYHRILKSGDPVTLSVGWRRFQTIPIYAIEDQNGRHRYLKYTPQHMHCVGVFWGPLVPPNTGFVGFQNVLDSDSTRWRPSLSGYTMQVQKSSCVVKKLKLIGNAIQVHKNSAFIQGMFNSALEVAKFEGARLRTVSSIRGVIKKAVPGKQGVFRATFEDRILKSDIVSLRTWKAVEPPKLYNPMTNRTSDSWRQMKLQNDLRHELKQRIPNRGTGYYEEAPRANKAFGKLMLPKNLQASLPWTMKKVETVGRQSAGKKVQEVQQLTMKVRSAQQEKTKMLFSSLADIDRRQAEIEHAATQRRVQAHKEKLAESEKRRHKHEMEMKKKKLRRDALQEDNKSRKRQRRK